MVDPSLYHGREQTYIKHFVLRHYLQKLAYKKGWFGGTLNYVDGFAGPWQHQSGELRDTSPFIAIHELREARAQLQHKQRPPLQIRCLFIEKDPNAWQLLDRQLAKEQDVEVEAHNGSFEEHIETIRRFTSDGFTFLFIDPTGWTGYALDSIAPLLRQKGEVLINFMTKYISRFVDHDHPKDVDSFNRLFGDSRCRGRWQNLAGLDREDEIVRTYTERVKEVGRFGHAVSTVILDPLSDRTCFHLIYATRHIEGLRTFRNAEHAADSEQQGARFKAQSRRETESTGQMGLFSEPTGISYSDSLRKRYQQKAQARLMTLLREKRHILFDDLEVEALYFPFMCTQGLKEWLGEQREKQFVSFEGLGQGKRALKAGQRHYVVLL